MTRGDRNDGSMVMVNHEKRAQHKLPRTVYFPDLLLNLQLYLTSNKAITPHGILATISRPTAYEELDHLIMVPGHSIWKGTDPGEHALLLTYARTEPSNRTTIQ